MSASFHSPACVAVTVTTKTVRRGDEIMPDWGG
jgi:hypothetical protein